MNNMLQNAKDLIAKGKKLNDPDLIKMGMDILNEQAPSNIYICQNCGHEIESNKKRKKCPNCNKHKLALAKSNKEEETSEGDNPFFRQVRQTKNRGQIVKFKNEWQDDMSECFDEEDAKLKKITKPSQRIRSGTKQIEVTCENCGNKEKVHPIHAPTGETRSTYMCARCIRNRRG